MEIFHSKNWSIGLYRKCRERAFFNISKLLTHPKVCEKQAPCICVWYLQSFEWILQSVTVRVTLREAFQYLLCLAFGTAGDKKNHNCTVAHTYKHAAEHKRHTDLLRGAHTSCAAHRHAARHTYLLCRAYYLLRGTQTCCATHKPPGITSCTAHRPPARHIDLMRGTDALLHGTTFCSVQQFSVPCSSFLLRAAVFCSAAGLYLWAIVQLWFLCI